MRSKKIKNIIRKIFLKLYEKFYTIEKYGLKNKIFTESELYDVRYKVNKEGMKK